MYLFTSVFKGFVNRLEDMNVTNKLTMKRNGDTTEYIFPEGGNVTWNNFTHHFKPNTQDTPIVFNIRSGRQIAGPSPSMVERYTPIPSKKPEVVDLTKEIFREVENYLSSSSGEGDETSSDDESSESEESEYSENEKKGKKRKLRYSGSYNKNCKCSDCNERGREMKRVPTVSNKRCKTEKPKEKPEEETPTRWIIPNERNQESLEEVDESRRCIICMDKKIITVFVPCGHASMCNSCCRQYIKKSEMSRVNYCPTCKQTIQGACDLFID